MDIDAPKRLIWSWKALQPACQAFRALVTRYRPQSAQMWCAFGHVAPSQGAHARKEDLGIELLVDRVGDLEQVVLADVGRGERIAELAVDPVEHLHIAFGGIAEGSLVLGVFGAHVQRDAP